MTRTMLVLLAVALLAGCENAEQRAARVMAEAAQTAAREAAREQNEATNRAKYESIKSKKILNVRVNDTTVDFILEDGEIVTLYTYVTDAVANGRTVYSSHIGVK